MLSHVMRFNSKEAGALYRDLAPLIAPELATTGGDEQVTMQLASHLDELALDLGLETKLSQVTNKTRPLSCSADV